MLQERLMAIVSQVDKGDRVADIGTDHGYLPIYLYKEGISPHVIMADVSKGSLAKAKANFKEALPESKGDFRKGYGLRILKKSEVEDVVIAGMGGVLISEIIGKDLSKAKTFKKFILQPRTGQGRLRYWLIRKGFDIVNEQLIREGRFICEVITAVPGEAKEEMKLNVEPDSIKWEMPPWVASLDTPLAQEFLIQKIEREKRILQSMNNSKTIKASDKRVIQKNIEYLESLLK